jgi:hypothetical protein
MRMRKLWLGALAVLALAAGRASALEIYFNGPGNYGVSSSTALAAHAAGFSIIETGSIAQASSFGIVIPEPDVLTTSLQTHPTASHPNRATSDWSVTNGGSQDLADAWLVFLRPLTYSRKAGIDLQAGDWALVHVQVAKKKGKLQDYYYPAVHLGPMESDETTDFIMHHLVAANLRKRGNTLFLPKYSVALLPFAKAPEPGTLALLGVGLVFAAALRRGGK